MIFLIAALCTASILTPSRSLSETNPQDISYPSPDDGDQAELSLPIINVIETLGLEWKWNAESGILTVSSERGMLSLMKGNRHVVSGDSVLTLKRPPFLSKGQLMVDETVTPLLLSLVPSSSGQPEREEGSQETLFDNRSSALLDRVDRLFRTVVIDAGHGGDDGGAIAPSGLKEKDLVLEIAKKVKEIIDEKMGVRVLLTRDGDYFVPLDERTSIAANASADLFVSIHANSTRKRSIRGIETYFMSLEATDEDAMAAAETENSVIKFEGKESDAGGDLAAILFDMAQTEHLIDSSRFAMILHDKLGKALHTEDRGVKQAPFIVLAAASMPAVLVEIGFMSNPDDMQMLKERENQAAIAEAIYSSIENFKKDLELKMSSRLNPVY